MSVLHLFKTELPIFGTVTINLLEGSIRCCLETIIRPKVLDTMTASLVLVTWASAVLSLAAGETCSKVSACSAEISRYPQLEEVGLQVAGSPISPQEASGWGSGMLPLYDELLDEQNPLDYTATPDVST